LEQRVQPRLRGIEANRAQATTLGDEITLADVKAVRAEIPYVVETAGTHDLQMSIVAGGIERPVTLVAVTEGFQRIRHLLVKQIAPLIEPVVGGIDFSLELCFGITDCLAVFGLQIGKFGLVSCDLTD
jgi:hypothetical protein